MREPFGLPEFDGPGTGEVVFRYDLESTMHAALENALDVPHTAFLHRGVFRGGDPREITAVRREVDGGVEVQYLGEPVGFGRFRGSKEGAKTFDHWDRFLLPCVAQIEYAADGWLRIVNTILHLPLSPFRTRAWFVVRFCTRFPAAAARPIVLARGKQILRQDAWALNRPGPSLRGRAIHLTSTDLDVIGNAVWRLLRQAEESDPGGRARSAGGNGDGDVEADQPVTFRV